VLAFLLCFVHPTLSLSNFQIQALTLGWVFTNFSK